MCVCVWGGGGGGGDLLSECVLCACACACAFVCVRAFIALNPAFVAYSTEKLMQLKSWEDWERG